MVYTVILARRNIDKEKALFIQTLDISVLAVFVDRLLYERQMNRLMLPYVY